MTKKYPIYLLIMLFSFVGFAQSTATYTITFSSEWTQVNHPHGSGNLPGNAHWSPMAGAVHNDQIDFLEMGELASPGVESIAETGATSTFFSEVNAEITNGTALSIINGPDLGTSAGVIEITGVEFNEDYSYLTLATMIAPSPDWMVALGSVNLRDTNGDWENQLVFDVYPYDAGTDSGTDYTSPNMNTNPADPISSLQGTTPFSNARIGTITLDLEEVLSVSEILELNDLKMFPNPTANNVTISANNNLKQIVIHNVLGKKVKQLDNIGSNRIQINTNDLQRGVYLVSISDTENKSTVKKLIKI